MSQKLKICSVIILMGIMESGSIEFTKKQGTLWAPYIEWSIANNSVSGNPFDLEAKTTFTHTGTSKSITAEMFYNGNNEWNIRFAGTKTGQWTFLTQSTDPELNGHTGEVIISNNPNPGFKGFAINSGNKFARQAGENGELEGFLFNIFMDAPRFPTRQDLAAYASETHIGNYLTEAEDQGFDAVFIDIAHNWFQLGAISYDDHNSENPDPKTFEIIEKVITLAHSRGIHVHFWAWGDQARHWTPIGVGGINGVPDKRLQRYIAARLGPLPGWSLGYGFDLEEWVSENEIGEWASYMHEKMGWNHLLAARGRSHSNLDILSHSDIKHPYSDAIRNMNKDITRPHFFEERDLYTRSGITMDWTRQHLWKYAMAGGHGGFWGAMWGGGPLYSNPEQIRSHRTFWKNHFFLDLDTANHLTDGFALKSSDNKNFVFYKESAASIKMDLSNMAGSQAGVAVDTKKEYAEIPIGNFNPENKIWQAPYSSDWAIAVGSFEKSGVPVTVSIPMDSRPVNRVFSIHPNPFNPATKILMRVPHGGKDVSLKIFSTDGKLLKRVAPRINRNGIWSHEYFWDASPMPSGIYLFELKEGKNIYREKAALMK